MTQIVTRRELVLAFIIVAMVLLIGVRAPVFLSFDNLRFVVTDTSVLIMMALAQMTVILTRGIDLSVAANLALTGMLVALLSRALPGLPIPVVMLVALLIGAGLGLVNGLLIAGLGIPPIVVTLGTLAIYRGAIFIVAGGAWLTSKDMTEAFLAFPKAEFLGLSSLTWVALVVTIGFYVFMTLTRTGRGLYAVGGNPVAARYCGVSLRLSQVLVYTLAGTISGLAGYLWVARFGIAYADIGIGYELTVIASCVIGGVSIAGGIGSVIGTVLGALFLGVVANALPLINISPFWQMAISGAVILAAVIVNTRSEWKPQKLILHEARRAAAGGQK
ncbi:MAG: ABC transporter permease [Ancalomicrobiaceae bacterium]|nr:ABC transporter permease [Ancalomicrobiaceae bacterium]